MRHALEAHATSVAAVNASATTNWRRRSPYKSAVWRPPLLARNSTTTNITPPLQHFHCNTPLLHYSITPLLRDSITFLPLPQRLRLAHQFDETRAITIRVAPLTFLGAFQHRTQR